MNTYVFTLPVEEENTANTFESPYIPLLDIHMFLPTSQGQLLF